MLNFLLVGGVALCGWLALRANRLLMTALWLAGASLLTSILLYLLGAHELAVIELSVGAGLVTVLFVFAIAIAGEDGMDLPPVVPKWLSVILLMALLAALGWFVLPFSAGQEATVTESSFSTILWQERALDVLVQIGLIFAGTMGVLGLLSEEQEKEEQP